MTSGFSFAQPQRGVNDRMPDSGVFGGFAGFLLVVVEVHGFTLWVGFFLAAGFDVGNSGETPPGAIKDEYFYHFLKQTA